MTNHITPDNIKLVAPLKAIRAKCIDCCCGSSKEVELCKTINCPIYHFRLGKNPYREKRVLSEEQRTKLAERMRKARKAKS